MHTFTPKQKPSHQTRSTRSKTQAFFIQNRALRSILHLQRTIGNQAVQRLLEVKRNNVEDGSDRIATDGLSHDFNRVLARNKAPVKLPATLAVSMPADKSEQEADRLADQVMRMPESQIQSPCACGGACPQCIGEQSAQTGLQAKSASADDADQSVPSAEPAAREVSAPEISVEGGRPLPDAVRSFFEPRFGHDLSQVRVHNDARAVELSQALHAEAFTYGNDIYFNEGRFAPSHTEGKRLLAHELAHVTQQTAAGPLSLQRRLLLTGTAAEIASFIAMCETASGLVLVRDPGTNEVTAIASSLVPATSPTFAAQLTRIMNAPLQNAEINVGSNQPLVDIGAFPQPPDLTAGGVQNVDMDDINAMEAGAPGIGVADLLHEIVENFEAHANAPVAGVDRFPAAHEAGLQVEAGVATDIVGSGRRVAQADEPLGINITRIAEDYDTYYVLSTLTAVPATGSFSRSNVSFAPKVNVTTRTVDGFGSGSDVVPPGSAATVAAVAAALAANPLATVEIEGFTDDAGVPANNLVLGGQRAESATRALVALGVDEGRTHQVARGQTGFVVANDSDAHRSQNRRVVFTVNRPGP